MKVEGGSESKTVPVKKWWVGVGNQGDEWMDGEKGGNSEVGILRNSCNYPKHWDSEARVTERVKMK